MRVVISGDRAPSAGDVRALRRRDVLDVRRSATRRHDWAPLSIAIMAAYARGAHVMFTDDIEMEK